MRYHAEAVLTTQVLLDCSLRLSGIVGFTVIPITSAQQRAVCLWPARAAQGEATIMSSAAMPYTGGDIKKSGELGKMFDIPVENSKARKSGPVTNNAPSRTGSFVGVASHSGPISSNKQKSNSGPLGKHGEPIKKSSGPQSGGVTPMVRQNSGPVPPVLPTTGLITSGPVSSGPLNSSGAPRKVSGPLDSTGSIKMNVASIAHNPAVTNITQEDEYSFTKSVPKIILWAVGLLFVMGFIAGGFILGLSMIGFISRYSDADLRTAQDGQYIKVSGVVTCGNVPLESSFQNVPRCVYTSTSLYEYRGWDSKTANPNHRRFTWGLRSFERHVVDFYISDFQSGLRALVKTGYGAKVTSYVDESIVVDINPSNKDMSPEFLRWLAQRNLSSDDRVMRIKEGYIKEGSTVSVMGVVRRNENVLMIVPPSEPFSTGCQWAKCLFPASFEGIVLRCEDTSKIDVIPV
uniref:Ubiquitin-specific protease family C19-related protein n=1 Tax=Ananas comosus var. bracteatus TaxID=296719 RepID=A0A6V7PA07_ANACO|nr:unnamed protein product [Ananas comosus var. bracteatus]